MALSERLLQDKPVQRGAAGEGHVHLPMGEGPPAHVDDRLLEGLALALVDGDGEGQAHRVLGEGADRFRGQLPLLQEKAVDLPGVRRDLHGLAGVQLRPDQRLPFFIFREASHPADGPVDPAPVAVVVEHHDLGALSQPQVQGRRQVLPAELPLDEPLELSGPAGQPGDLLLVDAVGQLVRAGQVDVEIPRRRGEIGDMPLVEQGQVAVRDGAVADGVEQADELAVLLAVDLLQLHEGDVQALEGPGAEEVGGPVMGPEDLPGVAAHHRRKLVEITDEDQLHTAEGKRPVGAVQPQEPVDTVEEVRPHHGDLVD